MRLDLSTISPVVKIKAVPDDFNRYMTKLYTELVEYSGTYKAPPFMKLFRENDIHEILSEFYIHLKKEKFDTDEIWKLGMSEKGETPYFSMVFNQFIFFARDWVRKRRNYENRQVLFSSKDVRILDTLLYDRGYYDNGTRKVNIKVGLDELRDIEGENPPKWLKNGMNCIKGSYLGYTQEEISNSLGVHKNNLQKDLKRTLEHIRTHLK